MAIAAIAVAMAADAAPGNPSVQQGNVIQLNGQPWTGLWFRRIEDGQQAIYLQDEWVESALGVDFLDSDRADVQRLKWFSSPFFARVALENPVRHRFLDAAALSPPWRTEVAGNVLRIYTPDVSVQAIRRGKQEWGDRMVIDLSGRAPWQLQEQNNEIVLALGAELAPNLSPGKDETTGNAIEALEVQAQGKQTVLRVKVGAGVRAAVETLGDPARIVVDFRRDYLPPDRDIAWAPGLRRVRQTVTLPNPDPKTEDAPKSLRFSVTALRLDLSRGNARMRPIWSNPKGMTGTSTLRTMAERWNATAAINGGFFHRDRQMPLGPIRSEGQWMAGPVLKRGAIAWNDKGEFLLDRLTFGEEVTTVAQQKIPLTHLNSGYVQQGIARYTATWGPHYVPLTDSETILTVQGDRVTAIVKGGKTGEGKVPIPRDGYLLVARRVPEQLKLLPVGTQLRGLQSVRPSEFNNYPYLIGAGPLLLKAGKIVLDAKVEQFSPPFDTQGAARSAIATTGKPGEVILATIQATPEGILPSLSQTAEIVQKLGGVDALNLDGGGSTSLFLGGSIINREVSRIAPIHNGIGITIVTPQEKPPSDRF